MTEFRPTCPSCGELLPRVSYSDGSGVRSAFCDFCGARTGLVPRPRARKVTHPLAVDQRPAETGEARYIVREIEGWRTSESRGKPGIECVVLDTAWNHRRVASFTSEQFVSGISRRAMFARARTESATRCDLLNRLDEIARSDAA